MAMIGKKSLVLFTLFFSNIITPEIAVALEVPGSSVDDEDFVNLTIEPSEGPAYSDYYLLHWKCQSGSPVANVTVQFENGKGELTKFTSKLCFGKPNTTLSSFLYPPSDAASLDNSPTLNYEGWHHLSYLEHDEHYEGSIIVCNEHACADNVLEFSTAPDDGTNEIPQEILDCPPMMDCSEESTTSTESNNYKEYNDSDKSDVSVESPGNRSENLACSWFLVCWTLMTVTMVI